MTPPPTPQPDGWTSVSNTDRQGSIPWWGAMINNSLATGVPEEGHYGVAVANPYSDGSFGVPSPPGSPPAVWCTKTRADGDPCKGKHLPDQDYCFAHIPKE